MLPIDCTQTLYMVPFMRRALPETAAMRRHLCRFPRTTSSIDLKKYPAGRSGANKSEMDKQNPGWGRRGGIQKSPGADTPPWDQFHRVFC